MSLNDLKNSLAQMNSFKEIDRRGDVQMFKSSTHGSNIGKRKSSVAQMVRCSEIKLASPRGSENKLEKNCEKSSETEMNCASSAVLKGDASKKLKIDDWFTASMNDNSDKETLTTKDVTPDCDKIDTLVNRELKFASTENSGHPDPSFEDFMQSILQDFPPRNEGESKHHSSHNAKGERESQAECSTSGMEAGERKATGSAEAVSLSEAMLTSDPFPVWPPSTWEEPLQSNKLEDVVFVPLSISSRLLPHQKEGVRFLYKLYKENRGGILGDDMGLGKTIQTIAFLSAVLLKPDSWEEEASRQHHPILIVTPTSVLRNWENEFDEWGKFNLGVCHSQQRDRVLESAAAGELEVVLASFDTFRLFVDEFLGVPWGCFVVDEVHRLKNEKAKLYQACSRVPTTRRYGLTGTVMQNDYSELYSVLHWAAPGCLGEKAAFRELYEEPLKQGQRASAAEPVLALAEARKAELVAILSRHMMRRTKESTIGHLLRGKEDNVVFCAMSALQTRAYIRLLSSPDFKLLVDKDEPCSCGSGARGSQCCHVAAPDGPIWRFHHPSSKKCDRCPTCILLPCLVKLQQASNHLELLKPDSASCQAADRLAMDRAVVAMALGGEAELVGGLEQSLSFVGLSSTEHCGKMAVLQRLLDCWLKAGAAGVRRKLDKVLLFSYSTKMLDILERFLVREGYSYGRLDGSTPAQSRQTLVNSFNSSPSMQVFLLSTRAGGLGLNLASANRVVIFDPSWNPAYDLQAQDRSFRFGQRRHVSVYRLLSAGSLEELVYCRQVYKQQLARLAESSGPQRRYFHGVQGSRAQPGELFGLQNLFRVQSQGQSLLQLQLPLQWQEEAGVRVCRDITLQGVKAGMKGSKGRAADWSEGEVPGISELAEELESQERLSEAGDETAEEGQGTVDGLEDLGVLHCVRNEAVVSVSEGLKQEVDLQQGKKQRGRKRAAELLEGTQKSRGRGAKTGRSDPKQVKESIYAAMASWKGMSVAQFSRHLKSLSELERKQLLDEYHARSSA